MTPLLVSYLCSNFELHENVITDKYLLHFIYYPSFQMYDKMVPFETSFLELIVIDKTSYATGNITFFYINSIVSGWIAYCDNVYACQSLRRR